MEEKPKKLAITESRHTIKSAYQRDTYTPVFVGSIIIIAKLQKVSPRCPRAEESIKKMEYIYTMGLFLVIKKNAVISFAGEWMHLQIIISSKVNKFQKDRYVFSVL